MAYAGTKSFAASMTEVLHRSISIRFSTPSVTINIFSRERDVDSHSEIESYRPPRPSSGEVRRTMMVWFGLACGVLAIGAGMFYVLTREPQKSEGSVEVTPQRANHTGVSVVQPGSGDRNGKGGEVIKPSPWRPDGAFFAQPSRDLRRAPSVSILEFPKLNGCDAIWGAMGRDARGHLWFGVSQRGDGSAVLVEYDPHHDKFTPRGDVVTALEQAGLDHPGVSQIKIHSRIVQARDGHLYFTSMDEMGENAKTNALSKWGSHLWRLRMPDMTWEHLGAAPEGLIALSSGSGNKLYALGYWGHVVYQYDIAAETWRSVRIGSEGGHISRNFFSDQRDHVYVSRFTLNNGGKTGRAWLVELDASLKTVAETPLEHYGDKPDGHGIVGFQPMLDHSIVFITAEGYLYRVYPNVLGSMAADVKPIGYMHPHGRQYIPSLFSPAGDQFVMGCSHTRGGIEWVVYDLDTGASSAHRLYFAYPDGRPTIRHLLYGSVARDAAGHFYLCGIDQQNYHPVVLRLEAP